MTSIAGLPTSSAIVCVGPPLLLRPAELSSGLVLLWLLVALNPQEPSSEILKPASVIVPEQLPPVLAARIVFLSETEPLLKIPPPALVALFPEKVLLMMFSVAAVLSVAMFAIAPPSEPLLPEKVLLIMISAPWLT